MLHVAFQCYEKHLHSSKYSVKDTFHDFVVVQDIDENHKNISKKDYNLSIFHVTFQFTLNDLHDSKYTKLKRQFIPFGWA